MIRGLSRLTKWDLLKLEGYNGGNLASRIYHKLPNFLKDAAYSPARFLVFMLALVPFYDKIVTNCAKKIFGNYYDGMKEEEYAEKKKEQKKFLKNDLQKRLYEAQANKLNKISINSAVQEEQLPESLVQQQIAKPAENLTKETIQNQAEEAQIQKLKSLKNPIDSYTYIPSQENILNNDKMLRTEKYIPSQIGAKFTKTFDNSALESALRRADRAELKAVQILSGKFAN